MSAAQSPLGSSIPVPLREPGAQWVLRTSYAGECTGADGPAVLHSHLEVERHEIGIAPNLI